MVIFILVGGWLVYSAIRFRARPGRQIDPPQVHGSSRLEWGWTIVPVLILIGLAGYTFHKLPDVKDAPSDSMVVNVHGPAVLVLVQVRRQLGRGSSGRRRRRRRRWSSPRTRP